jgi:hypothetical protein
MDTLHNRPLPRCHMAHVRGAGSAEPASVWICEYPYRTMRTTGPSVDCDDCPVWQAMVLARMKATAQDSFRYFSNR